MRTHQFARSIGDALRAIPSRFLFAAAALAISPLATAGTLSDGNFIGWSLSSIGPGTMTLETTGGNPGARLNATTTTVQFGPVAYDKAVNLNFSTTAPLSGSFTLGLEILRGPGDFGAGQSIGLLVQQGADLYLNNLAVTGSGHTTFDPLSFNGTFTAASFTHLAGVGSATPNFSGGTTTFFGFSAINSSNNATVTEYYDNFSLMNAAVPEPSAWLMLGCGGWAAMSFRRRPRGPLRD